jgi:hypothetical protein
VDTLEVFGGLSEGKGYSLDLQIEMADVDLYAPLLHLSPDLISRVILACDFRSTPRIVQSHWQTLWAVTPHLPSSEIPLLAVLYAKYCELI